MEFNIIQSLILFYITNLLKSNIYLIFYKKEPKNKFWVLFSISRTKDAFVQLESLSLSYEGQKQLDLQRQDR